MPLRKSPPKTTCSLRELLNWVAHDDYDGPGMSGAEAEVAIFGDTPNLEQIEVDDFMRSQSEQAAMDDILSAAGGGEIVAEGFQSETPSNLATDWKNVKHTDHDDIRNDIPETAWKMGVVDWDQNTLHTPSAEYIGIQFHRAEVEQVWVLDESVSSSIGEAESPSNSKHSYTEFKNQLLMALARIDSEEGSDFREPIEVADRYGLTYSSGWLRKAVTDFRDMGYINEAFTLGGGEDRGLACSITGPGLEAAEELAAREGITLFDPPPPSQPDAELPQDDIPASDRIVRRSDNEDAWDEAAEGVKKLRAAMEAANDYGDLSDDEFAQKLSEVRALQVLLDCPQIQWDVLERFSQKTVRYLAVKFAENTIGVAASALLAAIGGLAVF